MLNALECVSFAAIVDSDWVAERLLEFVGLIRLDGSADDALELDCCVDSPEESLIFVTTIFEAHRQDFFHLLRSYYKRPHSKCKLILCKGVFVFLVKFSYARNRHGTYE